MQFKTLEETLRQDRSISVFDIKQLLKLFPLVNDPSFNEVITRPDRVNRCEDHLSRIMDALVCFNSSHGAARSELAPGILLNVARLILGLVDDSKLGVREILKLAPVSYFLTQQFNDAIKPSLPFDSSGTQTAIRIGESDQQSLSEIGRKFMLLHHVLSIQKQQITKLARNLQLLEEVKALVHDSAAK